MADALDSGSSECKFMWVQVPSPAPKVPNTLMGGRYFFYMMGLETSFCFCRAACCWVKTGRRSGGPSVRERRIPPSPPHNFVAQIEEIPSPPCVQSTQKKENPTVSAAQLCCAG